MDIEVKQTDDKWGLFVSGHLIGTSKQRFDADFAKNVLTRTLDSPAKKEQHNCGPEYRHHCDGLCKTTFGALKPR